MPDSRGVPIFARIYDHIEWYQLLVTPRHYFMNEDIFEGVDDVFWTIRVIDLYDGSTTLELCRPHELFLYYQSPEICWGDQVAGAVSVLFAVTPSNVDKKTPKRVVTSGEMSSGLVRDPSGRKPVVLETHICVVHTGSPNKITRITPKEYHQAPHQYEVIDTIHLCQDPPLDTTVAETVKELRKQYERAKLLR